MGKMKAFATAAAETAAKPALIVFGLDEAKKAHASWFGHADAELAERAAGLMRMRALRVTTPEHRAIALALPVGRVFESGRGFLPFAKAAVYERLNNFAEAYDPPAPVAEVPTPAEPVPAVTGVPGRWDDIAVGSLVLASTGPMEGWFECVVCAAKGDDLYELAWRDWPDEPVIVRCGADLALVRAAIGEVA